MRPTMQRLLERAIFAWCAKLAVTIARAMFTSAAGDALRSHELRLYLEYFRPKMLQIYLEIGFVAFQKRVDSQTRVGICAILWAI
jgi:hypothetical protein